MLEQMILRDKRGNLLYKEGRGVVFSKLPLYEKSKILANIPKEAVYLRRCLQSFWRLNLQQDARTLEGVDGESLWYNHRFKIRVDWRTRRYCMDILDVVILSDIMSDHVQRPRIQKRADWFAWIDLKRRV